MVRRKVITIDQEKCTGCGLCIPNCPEGALQIIDGKARLVSDLFCDGLGACIGHCPEGAISIEEREGEAYDEKLVMKNIVAQGENTIKAHLLHLDEHNQPQLLQLALEYLNEHSIPVPAYKQQQPIHQGCPGSMLKQINREKAKSQPASSTPQPSALSQWPVQLHLVPVTAPFLDNADLLIAADCVPFAYASFHRDLLHGKVLLVGCPKLDDAQAYVSKLTEMFKQHTIKSITLAHMEVPCCSALKRIITTALEAAGKTIPIEDITISIGGERI